MYRAMQIANYIVYTALERGESITNLHLQKALYYLQADELVTTGGPLFGEAIEKWRLGPVIPEVYHEYKEYGSQPIAEIATEIIFDDETFGVAFVDFNEDNIDSETRERIRPTVIALLNEDPFDLVDRTHRHAPWLDLREQIESGERGLIYTADEIITYFEQNPDELADVIGG